MRPPGRVAAAIEVLQTVEARHRPVALALQDWGASHRFAGAGDRAAIGNLVYDALRWRASSAWRMQSEEPRAVVLATLRWRWGIDLAELEALCGVDRFAPAALDDPERAALATDRLPRAPDWVKADVPEWVAPSLEANFAEEWIAEGAALAARAPLDVRANTLKADRDKVLKALARFGAEPCVLSPVGVRIPPREGFSRAPNIVREEGYQRGWFEVQDEGSQVCALLVFTRPGEQVLDLAAGAGGKTLALSAAMGNTGQVHATDSDPSQLAPIYERIKRAGCRNVQVHRPHSDLSALAGRMDRVLVDAPCSGSGTWRRKPDSKWRLTPQALERRLEEQRKVLADAAVYPRPGGYLVYVTCSVLPEENEAQIATFLEERPGYMLVSAGEVWEEVIGTGPLKPWSADGASVTLTPAATHTDGFFLAVLERVAE